MPPTLTNIDPIKREPLATQVARRLVEVILTGQIEPGTRMPSERKLAETFGVGRSAMREALKALSLIGLVEVRQGDGTYLRRADSALLPEIIEWGLLLGEPRTMDLVEARQEIEIILAGFAASRRTGEDVKKLGQLLENMKSAATATEFVENDVAFHLALSEAARNSALRDIHSSIQALLRAWILRAISSEGAMLPSYEEHVPVYEAVSRGDAAAARQAMANHMTSAAGRLRANLPASEEAARRQGG
ncbi:FadR/GntR family transcriptional regulator [soil metagenome]